jgi:hypothetical protein
VRWIDAGVEPVGVIAIGVNATGVIAIGQLATGVIAIGQLARGGIAIGQLSLGIVAIGQLVIGVVYGAGMVGVAAFAGPWLVWGILGRVSFRQVRHRTGGPVVEQWASISGPGGALRLATLVATVTMWIFLGGLLLHPTLDDDEPAPVTTTTTTPPPTTSSIPR